MSDSVQPHRQQPTRLLCPWDSPSKNTGVGCHLLLQCMKVKRKSEVAQSLSDSMDYSLPGSSIHGIFQARVLEWGAIAFSNAWEWKGRVKSLSLLATPWTAAHQAPPSIGFSRRDFPGKNSGVGCHFLLQQIFLTQGLNLGLLHCRQIALPSEPPGKWYDDGTKQKHTSEQERKPRNKPIHLESIIL